MATLDRVPLFAKLTAAERAQLLGLMQPKVFTAGEKIIIEGDNGAHFFILQSGECNVTKIAPNPVDPEIFLETLSAGDYFGGISLNQHSTPEKFQ
jgi:CRP-like cAMP-binding protein